MNFKPPGQRWLVFCLAEDVLRFEQHPTLLRRFAGVLKATFLNTYRVWLRHELFHGRLSDAEFRASEDNLADFVKVRGNTKPHLACLM